MLVESRSLGEVYDRVASLVRDLERALDDCPQEIAASGSGTVVPVAAALQEFCSTASPLANAAIARFKAQYSDDAEFTTRFRGIYASAELELYRTIEDAPTRRATQAALVRGYRYSSESKLGCLERLLEEGARLKTEMTERLVLDARIDLLVAEEQGSVEHLHQARNKLELVRQLDSENAVIAALLRRVVKVRSNVNVEIPRGS